MSGKWQDWVIDLPLFFAFSASGMVLYYTFFCIGTEICRLKHRPLRSIKDLPEIFYRDLEAQALSSLPLTVLKKEFRREEHLFVLFRVTQVEEFRDVVLQLIGEDSDFEATLGDNAKLDRAFLRASLIHFHFRDCRNPKIRQIGNLIGEMESDKPLMETRLQSKETAGFTTDRTREMLQGRRQPKRSTSNSQSRNAGYTELSLFSSFKRDGTSIENGRQQLVSLASKITLAHQPSEG